MYQTYRGGDTTTIQEARENNVDLSVLWLEIANAYGWISQKMVEVVPRLKHSLMISREPQHQCPDADGFSMVLNGSLHGQE